MSAQTKKIVFIVGGGVVAYLIYRNFFAPDKNANSDMGGVDFGILDPTSW